MGTTHASQNNISYHTINYYKSPFGLGLLLALLFPSPGAEVVDGLRCTGGPRVVPLTGTSTSVVHAPGRFT